MIGRRAVLASLVALVAGLISKAWSALFRRTNASARYLYRLDRFRLLETPCVIEPGVPIGLLVPSCDISMSDAYGDRDCPNPARFEYAEWAIEDKRKMPDGKTMRFCQDHLGCATLPLVRIPS